MHARVAVYDIPGHRVEEATTTFREAAGGIRGMEGLDEVYVLLSRESGRALTMSMWKRQVDMEASRMRATRLRNEAANAVDGTIQSVVEYEVTLHETNF